MAREVLFDRGRLPGAGRASEQAPLIPDGELCVFGDVVGHLGLFGVALTFMPQIDGHLSKLPATDV